MLLGNSLLPAQLVAAFIKRMSRLGLSSPPASIVIIIPLIYNLLKRHPTCMQLIHGKADSEKNDSYDALEDDPMKSNALQSSLWELQVCSSSLESWKKKGWKGVEGKQLTRILFVITW